MATTPIVIRQVELAPGDYSVQELIFGIDFIVVKKGELKNKVYLIWDELHPVLTHDGSLPVVVKYYKQRSWTKLWMWRYFTTIGCEGCTVEIAEQEVEELPELHDPITP